MLHYSARALSSSFPLEVILKKRLDMDRIARGLGAERRGKVSSRPGYFGALALVAEVQVRFPKNLHTCAEDPTKSRRGHGPAGN